MADLEAEVTCCAPDVSKAQILEGSRRLSKMLSLEQREFNSPTILIFPSRGINSFSLQEVNCCPWESVPVSHQAQALRR